MNKYQESYDKLLSDCYYADRLLGRRRTFGSKNEILLQELVDKETPIKPNFTPNSTFSYCKKCKKPIHWATGKTVYETIKYCKSCGQAIDWSDDEA